MVTSLELQSKATFVFFCAAEIGDITMANLKPENLDRFDCQKTVREALLELDPEKLKQKVATAEAAIFDAHRCHPMAG